MNVAEKRGVTEIDNEKPKCKACGSTNIVFVEYGYGCPERHDGWSEIDCKECGKRFGRWSGKELKENELEKRTAMYSPVERKSKPITPDREYKKLRDEENGKKYRYDRGGFEPVN